MVFKIYNTLKSELRFPSHIYHTYSHLRLQDPEFLKSKFFIIIIIIIIVVVIIITCILIQEIGFTESLSNWKTFTESNSAQLSFLLWKR